MSSVAIQLQGSRLGEVYATVEWKGSSNSNARKRDSKEFLLHSKPWLIFRRGISS